MHDSITTGKYPWKTREAAQRGAGTANCRSSSDLRKRLSSRPEGAQTYQPRARQRELFERCCRPGYGLCRFGSPERAKQVAMFSVAPFQGYRGGGPVTQGGAPQLAPLRSALGCYVSAPIGATEQHTQSPTKKTNWDIPMPMGGAFEPGSPSQTSTPSTTRETGFNSNSAAAEAK